MDNTLATLDDIDAYRRLFTDAEFFRPAVEEICRRHGLAPCTRLRVGVPGTCPVFIVEERWLVKLFGRLFDGRRSYAAELAAARLTAGHPRIPTPALLASGELRLAGVDWPWPYLVFAYLPSASLGEARAQLSGEDQARVAGEVGGWLRALHAMQLPAGGPFAADWGEYLGFLDGQRAGCGARHAAWGGLPARWAEQIDAYLLPGAALRVPGERAHLIHADLTEDHVLGRVAAGGWETLALIDFGDARSGSLFYELSALHFSLFGAQRGLLGAFLEAYGFRGPTGEDFTRRAMSCALLHEFNVFAELDRRPDLQSAGSLGELAAALWRVD